MTSEITEDLIQDWVRSALQQLYHDDAYLIDHDLSERALMHKLAEHLQSIVKKHWYVDCEYNRIGFELKTVAETFSRQVAASHARQIVEIFRDDAVQKVPWKDWSDEALIKLAVGVVVPGSVENEPEMRNGLSKLSPERCCTIRDILRSAVFPDIIVHVRGEEGPNLLVIEMKTRWV